MAAKLPELQFSPRWLLMLGLAAGSAVAFNAVFPGAGVALALGIALLWFTRESVLYAVTGGLAWLRKEARLYG